MGVDDVVEGLKLRNVRKDEFSYFFESIQKHLKVHIRFVFVECTKYKVQFFFIHFAFINRNNLSIQQ